MTDIREIPAYGVAEAAQYLRIPKGTLRSWVFGQPYGTTTGRRQSPPIVRRPAAGRPLLSFLNLVEAHVLDAIRREHEIPLQKVRRALAYLGKEFGSTRPLIEHDFETDGVDLFVSYYGDLVNISKPGQMVLSDLIRAYLRRIERDEAGLVARLFPYTRKRQLEEPRYVVIDPGISFGRPVIAGTGIPTAIVAERYKAGESVAELARDYDRKRHEIEDAIRCELELKAA